MAKPSAQKDDNRLPLPVQVELYIEPDGTVTFADLAAELLPVARSLSPEEMPLDEPAKTETERQK